MEMQSVADPHLSNRLLAYAARIYSEQLQKGQEYDELSTTYSLTFTPYLQEFKAIQDEYYHVCTLRRNRSRRI